MTLDDDGDFHFDDSAYTSYGTGKVDVLVYVEAASDIVDALARKPAWVRERLTKLILVGDALPNDAALASLLASSGADLKRRIERHEVVIERRTVHAQVALDTPRPSTPAARFVADLTGDLFVCVGAPGELAQTLEIVLPHVPEPRSLCLVLGPGLDAAAVLAEAPALRERIAAGTVDFRQRTLAEQDDLDADKEANRRIGGMGALFGSCRLSMCASCGPPTWCANCSRPVTSVNSVA